MLEKSQSYMDIAVLAGVSPTAISDIINDTTLFRKRPKKNLEEIDEWGYYSYKLSQGLASNNSRTIGVVFSDIANPHFTQIFKGIEHIFHGLGYDLVLSNTSEEPSDIQAQVLTSLLS